MASLMSHLRVVLEGLAANICRTVGELPLLTPREERELLEARNATAADYPRDRCVHYFVESHAQSAPGRIAVADSRGALSYRELNVRANRLAHRLKNLGIGPGAWSACAWIDRGNAGRMARGFEDWRGVRAARSCVPGGAAGFQIDDCATACC
jgi:non-ribosomal peptide synthetase component F